MNIVLLGRSGVGKSSCGNIILGREAFETRGSLSSEPVTLASEMSRGRVRNKRLVVVDTPDLFDSQLTHDEIQEEIATIKSYVSPGPCVYLLVITLSELGPDLEGMLVFILEAFGKRAMDLTMALTTLTEADDEIIRLISHDANDSLPSVLRNKFHVFCRDDHLDSNLLNKIEEMLQQSSSVCGISNETALAKPRGKMLQENKREEKDERRKETEDQHKRDKPKGEDNRKEEMDAGQKQSQAFPTFLNRCKLSLSKFKCPYGNSEKNLDFIFGNATQE